MAFGVATVVTNVGKAMFADRMRSTPATYTSGGPKYLQIGTGATGAARTANAADTALSAPAESRTSGAETTTPTTNPGDTYQVSGTIAATASRAVDEGALFDAPTGGNMAVSWTQNVDNLNSGDSILYTIKVQLV